MDFGELTIRLFGQYLLLVFVLAITVEAILEPYSFFKGLQKRDDPDELLKFLNKWLSPKANVESAVVALLLKQYFRIGSNPDADRLQEVIDSVDVESIISTQRKLGIGKLANSTNNKVAIYLAVLHSHYRNVDEQRMIIYRTMALAIGIFIAFILQIDTLVIIKSLFPDLLLTPTSTTSFQIGGIIITGLVAGSLSSGWHDLLHRFKIVKAEK